MVDILFRWISLCQVALKGLGICGVGKAADFYILGPALKVVGLRGGFKRGIIWNREGEMKAICVRMCALERPWCSWSVWEKKKKKNLTEERVSRF